jgi:hypothetical protein
MTLEIVKKRRQCGYKDIHGKFGNGKDFYILNEFGIIEKDYYTSNVTIMRAPVQHQKNCERMCMV